MKYYLLSRDINPKVVGVTHGAGQFTMDSTFDEAHLWFYEIFLHKPKQTKDWWRYWATMPDHGSSLIGLTMENKSKHTDFVDSGGFMRGFIVSSRLRDILESAHLPNHSFFEATFNQNGKIIDDYWWFVYDMETGERTVDFLNSEFALAKHEQKYGKKFEIQTYKHYLDVFYETGEAVRATKLVFNKNFNQELDIFGTQFLSIQKAYLSDRLFKKWEDAKITGYVAVSLEKAKEKSELMKALSLESYYSELVFE